MTEKRDEGAAAHKYDQELVAVTRAGLPENVHRGRICVVSADNGNVEASYGDPDALAYVRSTAKPLQALASLAGGVAAACGWDHRHLAMMAASQRGYPAQMDALEEMLATSGVPEEALVFGETRPIASSAQVAWAQDGARRRKLYHTCAGKHLGMLAWCRLEGWPLEGYAEPDHPAQQAIVRQVREWCGADEAECRLGRDGCGLPVLAMPLRRIALGYGRLACADGAPGREEKASALDRNVAAAAARIVSAMQQYPDLVEGPGRLASLLLADPNIVAKSGAQGLFALGLRRERLGIAIHVTDGSEAAWPYIVMRLLERLGGASASTIAAVLARFPGEFRNDAGAVAGSWEALI